MPEFIIVQCFSCKHYQVNQRRKDTKFRCKLCGNAQSVRSIMARSHNAKELRPIVQRANLTRGIAEQDFDNQPHTEVPPNADACDTRQSRQSNCDAVREDVDPQAPATSRTTSRWAQYTDAVQKRNACHVDDQPEDDTTGEDVGDGAHEVVTLLPDYSAARKRRKKRGENTNRSHEEENRNETPQSQYSPQEVSTSAPQESYITTSGNVFAETDLPVDALESHDQSEHVAQVSNDQSSKNADAWGGAWNNNDAWA